jgi:micrococcal nuclease
MKKKINKDKIFKNLGVSKEKIATALGVIVLLGGSYGGYTVYKDSEIGQSIVTVSEVIDGDTFKTDTGDTIRIAEIDTPESNECFGGEATQALTELIDQKKVKLTKDLTGADNFGRLIRHVTLLNEDPTKNNINVANYLLENGFAFYTPHKNKMFARQNIDAEKNAQAKNLGLWSECKELVAKNSNLNRQIESNDQPADPKCIIKGNISDLGYGKKYFLPHCPNYNKVKIDSRKGDAYFCTENEAIQAGFSKSEGCISTGR